MTCLGAGELRGRWQRQRKLQLFEVGLTVQEVEKRRERIEKREREEREIEQVSTLESIEPSQLVRGRVKKGKMHHVYLTPEDEEAVVDIC